MGSSPVFGMQDTAGLSLSWPKIIQDQFALVTAASPTKTDVAVWTSRFQHGATAADLHAALAYTPEAEAALAKIILKGSGLAATSGALAASEALLASGSTLADIQTGYNAGGPFVASAAAVTGKGPGHIQPSVYSDPPSSDPLSSVNWTNVFQPIVTQVFSNVFARAPNSNDYGYWKGQLGNIDAQNGSVPTDAAAFQTAIRHNAAQQQEAYNDFETDWSQVLSRSCPSDAIAGNESQLYNGTATRFSLRQYEAYSQEASNDITALHQATLGTAPSAADLAWAQGVLGAYNNTQSVIRTNWATGPAETANLTAIFQAVMGRPPSGTDLTYWQNQIAAGTDQAAARFTIAAYPEARDKIDTIFNQALGRPATTADEGAWEGWLGTAGNSLASMRTYFSTLPEAQARIGDIYLAVLGRPADGGGLSAWGAILASGQSLTQIRMGIAQSPESANDIAAVYNALLGRAPSAGETAGMQAALGIPLAGTPVFKLTGTLNGVAQTFATANAATQLSELAVYVTLNSGTTPTLTDPFGTVTTFPDATQLAAYLLGAALQTGGATPVLLSTYSLTTNWLTQTGQLALQFGETNLVKARAAPNTAWQQALEVEAQVWFDIATAPDSQRWYGLYTTALHYAQSAETALQGNNLNLAAADEDAARAQIGIALTPAGQTADPMLGVALRFAQAAIGEATNPAVVQVYGVSVPLTNPGLVQVTVAAADVSLQEAAQPLGARHTMTERVYQDGGGTTVDITVNPNAPDPYGSATFHSKDQNASPVLGYVTAVLDIAAVLSGQDWALALTAALNVGESASNFAQGNALAGVLDLGTAAGLGAGALGAFAAGGILPTTQAALNATAGNATLIGGTVGGTLTVAGEIAFGTALVGGLSGIVNSAENNDGLGVAAATLETAAAVAGGLVTTGTVAGDTGLLAAAATAAAASGVLTGVNAIEHGHVADGLVNSLGALVQSISAAQQLISNSEAAPANAAGDPQGTQYAQNTLQLNDSTGIDSTPNASDPLVGKTVTISGPGSPSFTGSVGAVSRDGYTVYINGPGGSLVPEGIATVSVVGTISAVTASGISLEVAALNTAAAGLRLSGIFAPEFAPLTLTLSVLVNAYATHLRSLTVFQGTIPNTNISFVSDLRNGIVTVQQSADNYVQLAIGTDGTLTTADGLVAGSYSIGAGLTLNPVFQAEWSAGGIASAGDPNTVYSSRALGKALRAAGIVPNPSLNGPQPHHIVPEGGPGQSGNRDPTPSQKTLNACGINLDSVPNGVWVSGAYNRALNNSQYINNLNRRLPLGTSTQACLNVLADVARQVVAGQPVFNATGAVPVFN